MTTPSIEERMARLEGSYEQINLRLGRLEEEVISLRSEINALRSEMRSDMNTLRSDMNALRSEIRSDMNTLRSEMNARLDRMFFSTLALMGGVMASVVATILARLL